MKTTTEETIAELDAFICINCDINTSEINEYYMIEDHLWKKVNPNITGMLCIGCVENKLGRKLNSADFTPYPINQIGFFIQSARLINRITTPA